ncbi:MAG: ATP-binding protein [Candidatus Sumerlaeia bacterium]|nr:ATP-binding protein [Candidatus Sumerlaeia bacterium]
MKWLRTLRRKVLLTLLIVGLIPAAAGVGLTAYELWRVILDVSGNTLLTEARNMAGLLDREINTFITEATRALADHSELARALRSPDSPDAATSLSLFATALWLDSSTTRSILLVPTSGSLQPYLFSPTIQASHPANPLPYKWLDQQFREARRLHIAPGFKAVTVHTDPVMRRPAALVWLPLPATAPEGSPGWVCVEIPVDVFLRRDISRVLLDVDQACVITNVGHLLGGVRFPAERTTQLHDQLILYLTRREGAFSIRYADGERQMVGFSPLPLTRALRSVERSDADWYVCIGRDLQPHLAAFHTQVARDGLIGAALAALLSVLAWWFARQLTLPLRQLQQGVQRIAGGDLTGRVEIHTGDELESLAREFNTMAERLQQAAEHARKQMETVQRQAGELALLRETSHAINARLDLDQTLATFARETLRLIAYDRMSVVLLDDDGQHYTVQFVYPEMEATEFSPGTRHHLSESYVGEAVAGRKPYVRRHLSTPPLRPVDEFLASAGMQTVMFVPLISESKPIGSVNLASRNADAFTPEEQERMMHLAESVAVAIDHRRLYMRVLRFAEDLDREVRRRTVQLRMAQDKLVQTEKLAASGQLAAGIAHEINNPLGIIKNYLRLVMAMLRNTANMPPTALQHLQIIEEEINRIAGIVRNLLDLYHPREDTPVPTDLHPLIERVLELFAPNWAKKRIEVVRRLAPSLPAVTVSADRIRQVFINLFRNAEDAMEHGGRVTVTTRFQPATVDWEEDRVIVEVEDTGCGIPRHLLARVFDPFFTTKQGGAGTGLGLSVSFGIIRSYGGTLDMDSEEGRGTRVTISLPILGRVAAISPPPSETADKPSKKRV